MKIRTDFVTNSSSSCFNVIVIEKRDGTKFNLFELETGTDSEWDFPQGLEQVKTVNELIDLLWDFCRETYENLEEEDMNEFFKLKKLKSIPKLDDISAVSSYCEEYDWGEMAAYKACEYNNAIAEWLEDLLDQCAKIDGDPEAAKEKFLNFFDIAMIPEEEMDCGCELIGSVEEFEDILQEMRAGEYDEDLDEIGISLHHDRLPERGKLTAFFEEHVPESMREDGTYIWLVNERRFEFDKNREQ